MSKDNDLDLNRWQLESELRKLRVPFTTEENDFVLIQRYKGALNAQWLAKASRGNVIRRRKKDQTKPCGKI
jgi:hypothetical protein